MIPCSTGEREAEGKQDKMDGKEEGEVLLKGRGKTEQPCSLIEAIYNILGTTDHDKGLWGVLPHNKICVAGGAISVGRVAGRRLFIEVF